MHDTRSAALLATQLAPATRSRRAVPPTAPRRRNLVLAGGGAAGIEELCAPIERGLYVTRLWYVNTVEPRHAVLTGMTRDGTFLIEDGAIARPLRDVRFTDSALRILAATEELTRQRSASSARPTSTAGASPPACSARRCARRAFRVSGGSA